MAKKRRFHKRRPRDIIESIPEPAFESFYVKYRGKELKHASRNRKTDSVEIHERTGRKYISAHTHPIYLEDVEAEKTDVLRRRFRSGRGISPVPSTVDIIHFLNKANEDTMAILNRDTKTGKTYGSFILRKTKDTPISGKHRVIPISNKGIESEELNQLFSRYDISCHFDCLGKIEDLKRIADKFHLQYRELDENGKTVDSYNPKGVRDKHKVGRLESEALGAIGFFLLSAIFMSFRINGFTILNASTNSIGLLGITFFIVSLFFAILFLRKRRIRKKHVQRNKKSKRRKWN